MITRQQYINILRALDYDFKGQKKRVDVWRRPSDLHMVFMPRSKTFSEAEIISQLYQCGCSEEQIKQILKDC